MYIHYVGNVNRENKTMKPICVYSHRGVHNYMIIILVLRSYLEFQFFKITWGYS